MPRKKAVLETEEKEEQVTEEVTEIQATENKTQAQPAVNKRPAKYHNEVTLRGTIVKLIDAPTVSIVTLRTRATATISNYPTVMFFGPNKEKVKEYKEGDRVEIKATINSYDESRLKKGQSDTLLSGFSATGEKDYEEVSTVDGVKPIEPACFNDFNMIEVSGQVTAIECDKNNDITIQLRTFTNSRVSVVKYPYYARSTNNFLKNIRVHQYIRAIGTVQTANIPVDPEAEQAAAASVNNLGETPARSRVKTRKKQFYILYDVYPN